MGVERGVLMCSELHTVNELHELTFWKDEMLASFVADIHSCLTESVSH